MAKVEYIKNLISPYYKDEILKEIESSLNQPIWASSHKWSSALHKNMRPVLIRSIHSETETLHNIICSRTDTVKNLTPVNTMIYIWEPGSHIDWHDDSGWAAGVSIYLNTQDLNGGGAFAWQEDDGTIKMIYPEECAAIIQSDNTSHCVTMIHPNNNYYRMSIQMFYK